ncbi:MAG: isoleucine--tRNA ligase [Flavobacteriales bacterium]|nr:isoleucine--tRNA ligase [Flavobacteriales bacterium]
MADKYKEYPALHLPNVAAEVLKKWEEKNVFQRSIDSRPEENSFVFFEGPPSANGMPGIHHVMGRAIKDIFCRYKTLTGKRVMRKAGWDTHGLPVELGVEKELGITKEDIGKTISVEEYNQACRKAVMKYTDVWNRLTQEMGYWVNMDDPYVTYDNKYIESVWWQLGQIYDKGLLYKGYTIQPYSPKAGTGLSTHELNQPGTYRDVKDTTIVAQFEVENSSLAQVEAFVDAGKSLNKCYFVAWTTTPWTLPSNTALTVGPKIKYALVNTINKYTNEPITVILAEALLSKHFGGKKDPDYEVVGTAMGSDLVGMKYLQLLPWAKPMEDLEKAFVVIPGDFVTTEDGTGIVHTAPTFGADDAKVAKDAGVPPMLVADANGQGVPLVDLQGRFIEGLGEWSGKYVKNEYYNDDEVPERSVDVEIAIHLKERGLAFNVEKYEHSYPHCWRTDRPILYYPLDSWFIKVSAIKDRMVELNNTITWKPASTGTGRFGNWLENANDWNLSRSRYWGIPIPIWRTEEGDEAICISSVAELKTACEKSVNAGLMKANPFANFDPNDMSAENYAKFDLHKPMVDEIILVSDSGKPMQREADLIDVWFDSGSMPYAQWHYPFENKAMIDENKAFPADFIAEGVDQTRGWFYTLHAIATLNFDQVAYKTVVSNGLVLDKNGQKMSKRLGNAVDPFETLAQYGPDATRWYMITNAQPWDNLKFDQDGITEVQRKFFGTLYNTYNFFALYANIDGFVDQEEAVANRPEIDRWILSKLNSLVADVDAAYAAYEPTRAGRLIQEFVSDELSNWYVRLCRRRFWKGEYAEDKISAYQTLHQCLKKVAIMAAPIAPFYMDQLYTDLTSGTHEKIDSVHLADFPKVDETQIDVDLEQRMHIAQKLTSMVLGIRKKERLKVRQPLQKIMVPILDATFERQLQAVEDLVLAEVNVKELEYLRDTAGVLVKRIKPNFKALGPKFGKSMKAASAAINALGQEQISTLERTGELMINVDDQEFRLEPSDVEILTDDIPGWTVSVDGPITVALDLTLNAELIEEGIARELVNRIQNLRKDSGLELTDRIALYIKKQDGINQAVENNLKYISAETLAGKLELVDTIDNGLNVEVDDNLSTEISIQRLN